MYSRELEALRKAGRFRERKLYPDNLVDFASNDYLGLGVKSGRLDKAFRLLSVFPSHAPKASMLVNGYHPLHYRFEKMLAEANGFEAGIMLGSGFLANLALFEALVRRKDHLFVDAGYHASGMMATRMIGGRFSLFGHNDPAELDYMLADSKAERKIVAVEGVYSMSGDPVKCGIFEICRKHGALLVVDEAHSSGVMGKRLIGIFEYCGIAPGALDIKMGTLGKAYGSYGAYILASRNVISYLENRAKPVIYSTAPSVIDTALAMVNFEYILRNAAKLRRKLEARRQIVGKIMGEDIRSQILSVPVENDVRAVELQHELAGRGWLVGAIRRPTVPKPVLRIIPGLGSSKKELKAMLMYLKEAL
jgi:8-amino-7-oxononanoate synthase